MTGLGDSRHHLALFTPGQDAIGRIERIGDGVEGFSVGDTVFCDTYVETRHAGGDCEYAFIGCFELSAGSGPLLARWPNGSLATHMLLPAENATLVDRALPKTTPDTLCRLGWLGTAAGAFEKTGFAPGQSVAILGATGLLGVSAVLVALAQGADRVVAVGRSAERMSALERLDARVHLSSTPPTADDPVNLVVCATDGSNADQVEASLAGVRRNGALVILGALSGSIHLPGLVTRDVSVRGSLWFSRATPGRLVKQIANGTLPVDRIKSHRFSLNDLEAAMGRAKQPIAPFEQIVVNP